MAQKTLACTKDTVRAKHSDERYARDAGGEQHWLAGARDGFTYTTYAQFGMNWSGVKQIQSAYLVVKTKTGAHTGFPNDYAGILISRLSSGFSDPNNDQSEAEFIKGPYAREGKDTTYATNGTVRSPNGTVTRINITNLMGDVAPKTVKKSNGKAGGGESHHGFYIERRTTSKQGNPRLCVGGAKHPNTDDRPYIELNYIPIASASVATPTAPIGNINDVMGTSFEGTFDRGANQPADAKPNDINIELYKTGGTTALWSYVAAATPSDVLTYTFTVPLSLVGTTGSKHKFVSGQGYEWRVRIKDNKGVWTAWSSKRAFGVLTNPPVLTNPLPTAVPSLDTLNNVYFSAGYSDPDGNPLRRFVVQLRTQTPSSNPDWEDDLLWDSGSVDGAGWGTGLPTAASTRIQLPYGGPGLDPGMYSWRIQAWDILEAPSGWLYADINLIKGYEPEPGEVDNLTGYAQRKVKARILIKGNENKKQTVSLSGAYDSGSFKLTYGGQTTAAIAYNASAATMEARLEALSNLATSDVAVTKSGNTWTITFGGVTVGKNRPKMTAGSYTGDVKNVNVWSDRAPGQPVAIIEDAANVGASEMYNSGGEFYFSLPAIHPQVSVIEPYQVHYALEHYRGESWKEVTAGIITDFDATDNDVVFYGQDYMAILGRMVDERFNPAASADAAAVLWPATGGGSKYVNRTIAQIVTDQLDRSIHDAGSPLAFFSRGTVDPMNENINIFVSFKERLPFIAGLIESHRAATGKRTRVYPIRSSTGTYSWRVKDDIGRDRPNIRLEYGGLVQGFRVVPFGQFATRLPAIGRIYNQSKVEYYTATPPAPAGQDATWYDEVYGRYSVAATYQDMTDLNDLKRRANKAAAKMARVGKQLALNLRPGALKVKDGWDICDSVYVDINRGVVSTKRMGSGYWTIWGWTWELAPTGEETLTLSVLPKEDSSAPNPDLIPSEPINSDRGDWQIEARDPDDELDIGVFTHVNSDTGHIFQRDTTNGGWIDRTVELPTTPIMLYEQALDPLYFKADYRATLITDTLPTLPDPSYPAGSLASMPGTSQLFTVEDTGNAWVEQVGTPGPEGPPGPPGGAALTIGTYQWDTAVPLTPATGRFGLQSAPAVGNSNHIRFHELNVDSNNQAVFLGALNKGDILAITDDTGHLYQHVVTAPGVDMGTWWDIPIEYDPRATTPLQPANAALCTVNIVRSTADITPPDVPVWEVPPGDLAAIVQQTQDGTVVSAIAVQWQDLGTAYPNDDFDRFEVRVRPAVKDMPKGWHGSGQAGGTLGIGAYDVMVVALGDNGLPSMGLVQRVDVAAASSQLLLDGLAAAVPPTLTAELAIYVGVAGGTLYLYGTSTTASDTYSITSLGPHVGDALYVAPTVSKATFSQLDSLVTTLTSDFFYQTWDNDRWHWFAIRSVDDDGNKSAWSEERGIASLHDTDAPPKPSDVRAINGNKRIGVTFTPVFVADLNRYELRWKFSEGNVVPDWSLIPWTYDISLTNQFSLPVEGYGLVIGNVRAVDNSNNVVGGTADDQSIGWDDDGFTAESTPIPPEELAVEELFATYAHLINIDASQIVSGTLEVRADPGQPGAISIYNSAGQLAGRWDPFGWFIINTAIPTQAIRAKDGRISFTKSGIAGQNPWQWPEPVWTTAISADGINADYITTGSISGGHNRSLNSGFELAPSAGPKTTSTYDTATEWDTGQVGSATNQQTGQAQFSQSNYAAP